MTKRDIPSWLPLTLLVLVLLALFHRLLSGHTLFWGLPALQFYPWRHFAFKQIAVGRLPTWNPYVGAGAPLLANYQTGVFYPPHWLILVLPDPDAMSLLAAGHIFWAGLGMWLFTGALGLPRFGRGVSTLAFGLSSCLIARFGSFPTVEASAWMPWVFWLVHRVIAQRQTREAGWLALAVGMQLLTGHAQTTWYSLVGVGLYALWQIGWRMRSRPRRQQVRALVLLCLGMLLGAAIAAVQLIPTAEYLSQSQRSGGMDYDKTVNLSYSPFRLITLLSPNFYGTPADGSYLTHGIYFEDAAYIGFIPLVSAVAAVAGWRQKRRFLTHYPTFGTVPFWAILALGALLISTGQYLPIFRLFYDYVPTFKLFREPVRWLILTVFSLSVLAGIGTQHWGRGKWVVFWSRLATAGGGAMAIMALVTLQVMEQDSEDLTVLTRGLIVLGCWMSGAALLTLTQPVPEKRLSLLLWRVSVLVFIALDLAWANSGLNPTVPAGFYRDFGVSRPEGRIYWFEEYQDEVKFERFFDVADYRKARDRWPEARTSLLPNLNMLDRVPSLNNFDPLVPDYHRRYVELIETLGSDATPLLRAAGVSQVYGTTRPAGWQGEAPIFVCPDETLRAWLVPQAIWPDSDQAVEDRLRDPGWNPEHTVILSGSPPGTPPDNDTETQPVSGGEVIVLENRPTRIRYRVKTDSPAYLVISNTWYPGWTATLDDQKIDLYRANLAFQAVAIPPGGGDITLNYGQNGGTAGAGISLVTVLIVFGLVAFGSFAPSRDMFRRIPLPGD